ncbi:MAG: tail fiber protein [Sphingobacteriales bacterium]|nr:tail fiber protein [Sphingobacteriales bacterium]
MNTYKIISSLFGIFFIFSSTVIAQTSKDEQRANTVNIENSLQYIKQLQPKIINGNEYGFNTEEVQKVIPLIVKNRYISVPAGKNQYRTKKAKSIDMESLIPVLVASIKEQQAEIEALRNELNQIKDANKSISK